MDSALAAEPLDPGLEQSLEAAGLASVAGTPDEPTGQVSLPVDPELGCPGFYILRTHPGISHRSGRIGTEILLSGTGPRQLAGGLNFGGRATSSVRGFSAFSIANAADEDQVVSLSVDVGAEGELTVERRQDGQVTEILDVVIPRGETTVEVTVPPGFYVVGYRPIDREDSVRYAVSALTWYTDRPGGGFQGGAVVGGYHRSTLASTGFAGFCIAEPFDVSVRVLSRPTYGNPGAEGVAFSLSDREGVTYLDARPELGIPASPKPGERFIDCVGCPTMVVIPSGAFTQGSPVDEPQRESSEGPQRLVDVPAFAMAETEVTFAQWEACFVDGGCDRKIIGPLFSRGDDYPVSDIRRPNAQEYVDWLSEKTGQAYRLPSESEWEYAARAGTTGRFNTGDCISTEQANFSGDGASGCPDGEDRGKTVQVGIFAPNAFGLHDTHGNVWEWVNDCWNPDYIGAPVDGSAWLEGDCDDYGIIRGGGYWDWGPRLRSAQREDWIRDYAFFPQYDVGFRVARSIEP
ncbi:MAG: formylglycine-generating enzyme family protein [Wenzhouxiangella sp.]|nr:formylglycine-generating enzyme family protein [Wenzhouxiangella sp.]